MEFRVKALDREQAVLAQQVDAIDEADARRQLGLLGLRVISLTPRSAGAAVHACRQSAAGDLQPGTGGAARRRPVAGRIDRGADRERGECRGAPAARADSRAACTKGKLWAPRLPSIRRLSLSVRRNGSRQRAHRIAARSADPFHHLSAADRLAAQDPHQCVDLSGGAAGRRHSGDAVPDGLRGAALQLASTKSSARTCLSPRDCCCSGARCSKRTP